MGLQRRHYLIAVLLVAAVGCEKQPTPTPTELHQAAEAGDLKKV